MPRFPVSVLKKKMAERDNDPSIPLLESHPSILCLPLSEDTKPIPPPEPAVLIYNIRYDSFRQAPLSTVLKRKVASSSPLVELSFHDPPLLVDGRMQVVDIPRWKREIGFFWRTNYGQATRVVWRKVRLPREVWIERNFAREKRWFDLWIERA